MISETIDGITRLFYNYINPFICIAGIVCNTINLTVLTSVRLKESPFTYLTALACSDLLTLLFTLVTSLIRGYYDWIDINTEYVLKRLERLFLIPSTNVFSVLSMMIIVALTTERFIFTKFPMRAATFCTRSNARRILMILFGFILSFRLPMFLFSDAQIRTNFNLTNDHTIVPSQRVVIVKIYEEYQNVYFLISLTLFEIIPFFMLSFLNLNIVVLLKKSNRKLDTLHANYPSSLSKSNIRPRASLRKQESSATLQSEEREPVMRFQSGDPQRSRKKSISFSSIKHRRKQEEIKLTRQLVGLVTLVVMSEICSIITYEKITEYLIGNRFPGYMGSPYKLQVVISNSVILIVHSVNFLLLCAFNSKYFKIFKENYLFMLRRLLKKPMRRDLNRQLS